MTSSSSKIAVATAFVLCIAAVAFYAGGALADCEPMPPRPMNKSGTYTSPQVIPENKEPPIASSAFDGDTETPAKPTKVPAEPELAGIVHKLQDLPPHQRKLYRFIEYVTGSPWYESHRQALRDGTEPQLEKVWIELKDECEESGMKVLRARSLIHKERMAAGKFELHAKIPGARGPRGQPGYTHDPGAVAKRSENEVVMVGSAWNPKSQCSESRIVRINPGEDAQLDELTLNNDQIKLLAAARFKQILGWN